MDGCLIDPPPFALCEIEVKKVSNIEYEKGNSVRQRMENTNGSGMDRFLETLGEPLDSRMRIRLKKYYGCITLSLLTVGLGAALHPFMDVFKANIFFMAASILFFMLLYFTSIIHENRRLLYLSGFCMTGGLIADQFATAIFRTHSSMLPVITLSASVIFASFTLVAFYANDRKSLYLGGLALSLASTMLWMKTLSMISGARFLLQMNLYTGLVFTCAFVIYETHHTIEQPSSEKDYVWHPIGLLLSIFSIISRFFVSIFFHRSSKNKNQLENTSESEHGNVDRLLADLRSNMKEQTTQIVSSIKGEVEILNDKVRDLQRETRELKKLTNGRYD